MLKLGWFLISVVLSNHELCTEPLLLQAQDDVDRAAQRGAGLKDQIERIELASNKASPLLSEPAVGITLDCKLRAR